MSRRSRLAERLPSIENPHTPERHANATIDVAQKSATWKQLFSFTTLQHIPVLASALSVCAANGVILPLQAIFVGRIYNGFTDWGGGTISPEKFHQAIRNDILALVGLSAAAWILNSAFLMLWIGFGELQARTARLHLFDGLLAKPCAYFDTLPTGIAALSPRLQTQIREMQLATSQPLGSTVQALVSAIASTIISFRSSWSLTLILLGPMPINAFIISYVSGRMQEHVDEQVEHLGAAAKHSTNAFTNVDTVKYFNGQSSELERFQNPIAKAARAYIRQVRGNAVQMGWMMFATFVTFLGGFYYGSKAVRAGTFTTADFITAFFSCLEVANAIKEILPQMLVLEKGRAAAADLRDFVEDSPSRKVGVTTFNMVPRKELGTVTFMDVCFAYSSRPEIDVVSNVGCSFAAGRTTFLIGRSGSGKSTLPQLLLKFYETHRGKILLDGLSIADIDTTWIRKNVTLVNQEGTMFYGTIFENISVGAESPQSLSFDDFKAATDFALLTTTMNDFPEGLHTVVGRKGNSLSGGQRQRVSLARARLRDSPVLILDESTSALDHTSRTLVLAALRQWRRGKTTIYISHDVSQIEIDDTVHLFEEGRLVASGTRRALENAGNEAFTRYLPMSDKAQGHQKRKVVAEVRSTTKLAAAEPQPINSTYLGASPSEQRRGSMFIPSIYGLNSLPTLNFFSPRTQAVPTMPVIPDQWHTDCSRPQTAVSDKDVSIPLVPLPVPNNHRMSRRWSVETKADSPLSLFHGSEVNILEAMGSAAIRRREGQSGRRRRRSFKLDPAHADIEALPTGPLAANSDEHSQIASLPFKTIVRTIWPSLHSNARIILIWALLCLFIHSASIPTFAWLFSKIIATFYMGVGGTQEALKWSMVVLGLSIVDGIAAYFQHTGLEYCAQVWVDHTRMKAMQRLLDQPKSFFEDEKCSPSQLASTLDRDAEEMRNILGRFVSFLLSAIVMLLISLFWSLAVCWKLALVGFALTPLSWLLLRIFQVVSTRFEGQSNDASEATAGILNEVLTNIKTVRAYTLEHLFSNKHSKAVVLALRVGIKRALTSGFFFGIAQSSMSFINCLVYYYGSVLASNRDYPVVDIVLVFGQFTFAISSVTALISVIPQVASSKDTARRLLYLANLPQHSHEHSGSDPPPQNGDITFSNVTFAYPTRPTDKILNHLNLTLRRGSMTAIVGGSGSGKSTIASLLLRLYPLPSHPLGSGLKINGRSIDTLSTHLLREHVAIIPQTPVLFPTTVAENIAYGLHSSHPFNTAEAIQRAAHAAGLHEFLAGLPQGYNTLLGDGGTTLSGGQAQRLAIARALVREPKVLVADEVTSALDVENSAMIRETLRKLVRERKGMAVVAVTHEKEMMQCSDWVVVVRRGVVVQEGGFEELAGVDGELRRLLSGGVWVGGGEEGEGDVEGEVDEVVRHDDMGEWSDVDV